MTRTRLPATMALMTVAATIAAAAHAPIATAACSFDTPYRTTSAKNYLTPTFPACSTPDTNTATGQLACLTAAPQSTYAFTQSGRCATKTAVKLRTGTQCGGNPARSPCTEILTSLKCKGLAAPSSLLIVPGSDPWRLAMTWRLTIEDPSTGPMTLVDWPLTIVIFVETPGTLQTKISSTDLLEMFFGPDTPLTGCANAEAVALELHDPLGQRMAAAGAAATATACNLVQPRARFAKTSMVRAYAQCPSAPIPAPNTASTDFIPACVAVTGLPLPFSTYEFGDEGRCYFKAKAYAETTGCNADPTAADCLHADMKYVCKDVVDAVGDRIKPAAGEWSLRVGLRATFDDRAAGQTMTTELSVEIGNRPNKPGKLIAEADLADLLVDMFGAGGSLPLCSSLEITSVEVVDDDGAVFAVPGQFAGQ